MNWFSALVLFAVIWFMVLFVVLPLRQKTQGDEGEVVPGTHVGAPANFNPKRTAKLVTVIAMVVWALVAGVILSGAVNVHDLDRLNHLTMIPADGTGE